MFCCCFVNQLHYHIIINVIVLNIIMLNVVTPPKYAQKVLLGFDKCKTEIVMTRLRSVGN